MATNRSHGELYSKRLQRFQNGEPVEIIGTLLNSIHSFFNNELTEASKQKQTSLLFLGIHAAILTISEALFNKTGLDGYKYFLEKFVDGDAEDLKFSKIASKIHDWRNILAHQWLGSMGHSIGYDYTMKEGWKDVSGVIYINPQIYYDRYIWAFSGKGEIYDFLDYLSDVELNAAKTRMVNKYINR